MKQAPKVGDYIKCDNGSWEQIIFIMGLSRLDTVEYVTEHWVMYYVFPIPPNAVKYRETLTPLEKLLL